MTTPRELLAQKVSQAQQNSYFIDKMGIPNVKSYGADGDGVTNDSTAFQSAIDTGASPVFVPYSTSQYLLSSTVSPTTNTSIWLNKASQLNTSQTLEQLKALVMAGGYWGGIPIASGLREGKIEIVCGTIRQSTSDRTQWTYINDASHSPQGVSGTYATASGSQITIAYGKPYSKVLGFICGPDETLANSHNLSVGASVGLGSAVLQVSGVVHGAGNIYYDGAQWVSTPGTGQDILATPSYSTATGTLTVTHNYCRGTGVTASPYFSGYSTTYYYIPNLYSIGNSSFGVRFVDISTNAWVKVDPNNKMSLTFTKLYAEGFHVDGSTGSSDLALDQGNIWFLGLFQV